MKARVVLTEAYMGVGEVGKEQERALLAQTPAGEGIYIAPDGELMALDIGSLTFTDEDTEPLYRLVPIEGDDR